AYPVGSRVAGTVVSVTDYGAFVELEPGIEGLVHVSEMSWSRRPKHPSKILKPGDQAEFSVLDINPAQRRISLSLKQSLTDPWTAVESKIKVGDIVKAKVARVVSFGAFVDLGDGVEGLCHVSEMDDENAGGRKALEVGSEHDFRVIRLETAEKKVGLSLRTPRAAAPTPEKPKRPESASAMMQALSSAGLLPA